MTRDPVVWVSLADLAWGRCDRDELIVVSDSAITDNERHALIDATPEARALILWRVLRRTEDAS